ncbi:hypothetical protein HDU76_008200 [Blyttiomyces sp. JEL0837]|nr:hypothetical protein HDU76_008200 [Blyttiomyces sp. JEL0837]
MQTNSHLQPASSSSTSTPKRRRAFRFNISDDITLLETINTKQPWKYTHGSKGDIWQQVADQVIPLLRISPEMLDGPASKRRFGFLVDVFRKEGLEELRNAGSEEEVKRRKEMLEVLVRKIDDYNGTHDQVTVAIRTTTRTSNVGSSSTLVFNHGPSAPAASSSTAVSLSNATTTGTTRSTPYLFSHASSISNLSALGNPIVPRKRRTQSSQRRRDEAVRPRQVATPIGQAQTHDDDDDDDDDDDNDDASNGGSGRKMTRSGATSVNANDGDDSNMHHDHEEVFVSESHTREMTGGSHVFGNQEMQQVSGMLAGPEANIYQSASTAMFQLPATSSHLMIVPSQVAETNTNSVNSQTSPVYAIPVTSSTTGVQEPLQSSNIRPTVSVIPSSALSSTPPIPPSSIATSTASPQSHQSPNTFLESGISLGDRLLSSFARLAPVEQPRAVTTPSLTRPGNVNGASRTGPQDSGGSNNNNVFNPSGSGSSVRLPSQNTASSESETPATSPLSNSARIDTVPHRLASTSTSDTSLAIIPANLSDQLNNNNNNNEQMKSTLVNLVNTVLSREIEFKERQLRLQERAMDLEERRLAVEEARIAVASRERERRRDGGNGDGVVVDDFRERQLRLQERALELEERRLAVEERWGGSVRGSGLGGRSGGAEGLVQGNRGIRGVGGDEVLVESQRALVEILRGVLGNGGSGDGR